MTITGVKELVNKATDTYRVLIKQKYEQLHTTVK